MINRICFLGTPRCGSQYVSDLLANTFNLANILEPFSKNHEYTINLDSNNNVQKIKCDQQLEFDQQSFEENRVEYTLNVLQNTNIDQPIVMKYFLIETFELSRYIINELEKLNFKIFILKRKNIENQLISYAIARSTDTWVLSDVDNKLSASLEIINFADIEWLYKKIIKFDHYISRINLPLKTLYYETAVDDLSELYHTSIPSNKSELFKILPDNPYSLIINAEQVREYINNLINKDVLKYG